MTTKLPESLRAPIKTLDQAKAWIKALHDADLMFHFEDDPGEIYTCSTEGNESLFPRADLPLIRRRIAALYALEWGPKPGMGKYYCPIGYALTLDPFPACNQAEGYLPGAELAGARFDDFEIIDSVMTADYVYGAPGRYELFDVRPTGGHVGAFDTFEEAKAAALAYVPKALPDEGF